MGTLHLKDINPQVLFIAALTACLIIHIPSGMHTGHLTEISSTKVTGLSNISMGSSNSNVFYLTSNITVESGENYYITNESLVLESLEYSSLSITVFGNLTITNSLLSLSNASYSLLKNFSIYLEPGSLLNVMNSKLIFPGALIFNQTKVRIENSTLNTSLADNGNPYDSSLRISSSDSDVSIENSTINGLYRQTSSHEYTDGFQYLYDTPYSISNTTIPMVKGYNRVNISVINSVMVNITYNSDFNESSSYLNFIYEGSSIDEFPLYYNLSDGYVTSSFLVNLTGIGHNLSWMEISSNFHLYSKINSNKPITIYNISEYFLSNDTVSLYGKDLFSYNFTNSNITVFNSTIGLNNSKNIMPNGQWNPFKNFLYLRNSRLVMGDSSLMNPGNYNEPFFINNNSTVTLFKTINVQAYSHNIPVQDLHYNLTSEYAYNPVNRVFTNELNSTGSTWISTWKYKPAVYDVQNVTGDWNYTATFSINSSNSIAHFSIPPFPTLDKGMLDISFNDSGVPFALFSVGNVNISENGTGNFTMSWTGNMSQLRNMEIYWTISNGLQSINEGSQNISNPGIMNSVRLTVSSGVNLLPGEYTLQAVVHTSQEHAFNNTGKITKTFTVYENPPLIYRVNITRKGSINGTVWGISTGNQTFYTNGTEIIINITGNETAQVLEPSGFVASPQILELTPAVQQYSVSFNRIRYEATFENAGITGGLQWNLIIAGKEYHSTNSSIQVNLEPGSYNYEVMDPSSYTTPNQTGIIHISNESVSINFRSHKILSWTTILIDHVSTPEYYIPLTILTVSLISLIGWDVSHTWYACPNCGSTRKRKKQSCPYCGK